MEQTSPLVKKTTTAIFIIFFALFIYFKPYENAGQAIQGSVHVAFSLFNFIINQTLGIVHESGHGVCYILHCPQFISTLNGTLFQWLFPFFVAYYYKRRGQRIGYFIGLFILGISMHYTAWYMGTSNQGLHVSAAKSFLGVDGYHDFNYMFSALGLLEYYNAISIMTRLGAYLVMFYSVIGMTMISFMSSSPAKKKTAPVKRQTLSQRLKNNEFDLDKL